MHAAHQPHGLISMFGRLVAHGQHAGKRIVHHQVNTGVGSLSCVNAHAHFDHQRRRAQHDMAGADIAGQAAFHLLHIACGKGHAISFTRCVGEHAPKLQPCSIRQCRRTGEHLVIRQAAHVLKRFQADRAGREQVVFDQHNLFRAAQQVSLPRPGNRRP